MKNAKKFSAFAAMAAAMVCVCTANAATDKTINGRFDIDKDYNVDEYLSYIGTTENSVVHQGGHSVHIGVRNGEMTFGAAGLAVAYLLDDGLLTTPSSQFWRLLGDYTHFRQTGGAYLPGNYGIWRNSTWNTDDTLPSDFVFSGDAVSTNKFRYNDQYMHANDFNLAVMDNANIHVGFFGGEGEPYKKIVAVNGGEMHLNLTLNGWKNTFFAFNGGTFMNTDVNWGQSRLFGTSGNEYTNVYARIYENGANIVYINSWYSNTTAYGCMPALRKPEGNVITRIELSNEVKEMEFDVPPAVVIKDSTDNGSNAVAVVDYDFATKAVTNITIVCRGENYSGNPGDVTAELRYKATGDALATLVCETGPCQGGDVTIGGLKKEVVQNGRGVRYSYSINISGVTNTYYGATIIDADPDDICVGAKTDGAWIEPSWSSCFLNSTQLVMRSGFLYVQGWSDGGKRPTLVDVFPACRHLEFYKGYIGAYGGHTKYSTYDTITIGGEAKLRNRTGDFDTVDTQSSDVRIAVSNALYVDVACMTNAVQVTPAVIRGRIKFNTGSKVAVKNWKLVPRGRWQTVLDLSNTVVNKNVTGSGNASDVCVPEFEYIDGAEGELDLKWDYNPDDATKPYKLKARRHSEGMFLIFK